MNEIAFCLVDYKSALAKCVIRSLQNWIAEFLTSSQNSLRFLSYVQENTGISTDKDNFTENFQ